MAKGGKEPKSKPTTTRVMKKLPGWLKGPVKERFRETWETGAPWWEAIPAPEAPSPYSMMPQAGWWEGLDPNVRAGIMEPWTRGQEQLFEEFGARGMGGSPRAGMSGAFGQGYADWMSQKALPSMMTQGWGMVQPALASAWNAEQQRRMATWGEQLKAQQYPYNLLPTFMGQATQDQAFYYPQSSAAPWGGAATGALAGGSMGSSMGPWGAFGGSLLGGTGGYLGGK